MTSFILNYLLIGLISSIDPLKARASAYVFFLRGIQFIPGHLPIINVLWEMPVKHLLSRVFTPDIYTWLAMIL